jgi:hypothetical protein
MARNDVIPSFDSNESRGDRRSKSLRHLPKSWIIAFILFYCASVITVGLLAGLLPKRVQHVVILATPTQITSTTTQDPSICIDDECNPRLSSDIFVHSYELEYIYNHTNQTTVQ